MQDIHFLEQSLRRIDRSGYGAYKSIAGDYVSDDFSLHIDYVQGDPFASPSKIRLCQRLDDSGISAEWVASVPRILAVEDFLARRISSLLKRNGRIGSGSGKSGNVFIDAGHQEILRRTAVRIDGEFVDIRLEVGLPAAGRRVLGQQARTLLCEALPEIVCSALRWSEIDTDQCQRHVHTVENYLAIRQELAERSFVAFIANNSILPRKSGASAIPKQGAVPFQSPESMEVMFEVPHKLPPEFGGGVRISGMGIREGITLIAGGGYHGKSTLLQALQYGVYPHIPGDGREYVVTQESAVKVRAEDGRAVTGVNISGFMQELPGGVSTESFSTENASGSTSQAAGIIEALESGSTALLVDEDTSATNFMIRDARMQRLVDDSSEPIIPFIERIEELHQEHQVSTVLVMGGCGDYLDVAQSVIVMQEYLPIDRTDEARQICQAIESNRQHTSRPQFTFPEGRSIVSKSIDASRGRRAEKVRVRSWNQISFGEEEIELAALEQIVDPSQTRAIAKAIAHLKRECSSPSIEISKAIDSVCVRLEKNGPDFLGSRGEDHPGNLSTPRRHELLAALGRLRSLRVADA